MKDAQDDNLTPDEVARRNIEGSRQLILAVLQQAMWDASQPHWQRAQDALGFFFGDGAKFYTELLGIDHERFMLELWEAGQKSDGFLENYYRWAPYNIWKTAIKTGRFFWPYF